MAGGNQITFGVGFNVNESGLNKLKQSLQEIQQLTAKQVSSNLGINEKDAQTKLNAVKQSAKELEIALKSAFNPTLGTTNIAKFNQQLQSMNLAKIAADFNSIGAQGQAAFLRLTGQAMTLNSTVKQSHSLLTKMGETFANTIKWGIASSIMNTFTRSISSSLNYVKALDSSLTDIRIVTGQSRDEMAAFAVEANNAAQALGRQTKEYTNAALAFYQQGLNDKEVQARTEATLKAQNVTNAGEEMAEYLTAVWNGFKVSTEETEKYVDKLAAVADSSASNLSELALAMSKVASSANNLGVDVDQLAAQISTIIATTRQAPQTVGNALKTIYARINDIKSGSDEAEISLGNYTSKMNSLGISVLDANGKLRSTGDVMEEIGAKWSNMTKEQQIYLAQTMAGQRQMNNLIALFDNWQKYSDMLNVSLESEGALNEKNARYMESVSAHINKFKAAIEGLQSSLLNSDTIKNVYDAGTKLVNLVQTFVNAIGGSKGILIGLGALATSIFRNQIADSIAVSINNIRAFKENLDNAKAMTEVLAQFKYGSREGLSEGANAAVQSVVQLREEFLKYQNVVSQADQDIINGLINQQVELKQEAVIYDELIDRATELGNAYLKANGIQGSFEKKDLFNVKFGNIDFKNGEQFITANIEELETLIPILDEVIAKMQTLSGQKGEINVSSFQSALSTIESINAEIDKIEQSIKGKIGANYIRGKLTDIPKNLVDPAKIEELEKIKIKYQQLKQQLDELEAQKKEMLTKTQTFLTDISEAATAGIFEGQTEKVQEKVELLRNLFSKDTLNPNEVVQANQALDFLDKAFQNTSGDAEKFIQEIDILRQRIPSLNVEMENSTSAVEALGAALRSKEFAKGISDIFRGVSSLAMGINSLSNAHKTYQKMTEGSISSTEGLIQMLMSLSMGLPMLVNGFKQVGLGLSSVIGSLKDAAAAAGIAKGAVLGISAGIVAAIAAIAAVLVIAYQHYTRFETAAKRAEKAAENLKTSANNAKTAAKELKDTFSEYDSAVEVLNNCVQSTEEWKEALNDVNDKALEILQKYPELLKYQDLYTRNANGMIEFNQQVVEQAIAGAQQAAASLSYASMLGDVYAGQARNTSKSVDWNRAIAGNNKFIYTDALTGDIYSYGEVVGQRIKENFDQLSGKTATELKTALTAILSDLQGFDESWVDAATSYVRSLENITKEQQELAIQLKNIGGLIASQQVEGLDDATAKVTGTFYNGLVETIKNSVLKANNQISRTMGRENSEVTSLWNRYLNAINKSYNLTQNAVQGNKQNRTFHYIDENNKEQKVTIDEMAATIAAAEALNELGDSAKSAAIFLQKLDDLNPNTSSGIKNWIASGNFNNMSQTSFDLLQNEITAGGGIEAYLKTVFKTEDLTEVAERLGFHTVEELIQGFTDGVLSTENSFDAILQKSIVPIRKALLNYKGFDQLNVSEQSDLQTFFTKVYGKTGSEGLAALSEILSQTGEDANAFVSVLNGIDWQDVTVKSLSEKLKEAGINASNFEGPLATIVSLMAEAASFNLENSTKKYSDAMAVANGLQYGKSISQEDYDKLRQYNIDGLRDMFQFTRDGQYQFIGSIEDLVNQINQLSFNEFNNGVQEATEKVATLESLLATMNQEGWFEQNQGAARTGTDVFGVGLVEGDLDTKKAQTQLDFVSQFGNVDASILTMWQEALNNATLTSEQARQLAEEFDKLKNNPEVSQMLEDWKEKLRDTTEAAKNIGDILDEDINAEEFEILRNYLEETGGAAQGFADEMLKNEDAAKIIAQELLRCKAASKNVQQNLEKWKKAFADPTDDAVEFANSLNEVDNAYKDLLNLNNSAELSQEFLSSAENLQLMEEALNGSVEAYQQLEEKAQEDIVSSALSNLQLSPDALASLQEAVMADINAIENAIKPIEVGTDLQTEPFIAGLEEIINAAGMTAEQATALLASMGIDAEVVKQAPETSGASTSYAFVQPATYAVEENGMVYDGAGGQVPYRSPRLLTRARLETVTTSDPTTSPSAFALKITNAKKGVSSGGKITSKKLASSGGAGGNKGGGGGGKQAKPQEYKPKKIDPYHRVNIQLDQNKQRLTRLQRDKERTLGKETIENLRQQIALLDKERELIKEKEAIADQELETQKKIIEAYGFIIDKDGVIINYGDLIADKQKEIVALVNEYNEILETACEETLEGMLKKIEELKETYDQMMEDISDYESTVKLKMDLEDDYREAIDEQIEAAIEGFNVVIKLRIDIGEAERDFNNFRKKVIDHIAKDDYAGIAKTATDNFFSYINREGTGQIEAEAQHLNDAVAELKTLQETGWSGIYGDNLAKAMEDVQSHYEHLMDSLEEARDLADEVHDNYIDALNAMQDVYDRQIEMFDSFNDYLDHNLDMLAILHNSESEANYDERIYLYEQQIQIGNERITALREQQSYWKEKMDALRAAGKENTEEYRIAFDNWNNTFNNIAEAVVANLEKVQQKWEETINKTIYKLKNQAFGGDFSKALDDWDQMVWDSDRYLDNVERATELSKLQGKYIDLKNSTTNAKLQKQIADLEDQQLTALAKKKQLREVDFKLAEAQLEVLKAQIALEDAQQAKTKLRLRRDSQGNYTYQYVADEDDILTKKQNYLNALSDYRAITKEQLRKDLEDLKTYTLQYFEELADLQVTYGNDEEELARQMAILNERYFGKDGYITKIRTDAASSMTDAQQATLVNLMGLNKILEEDTFKKFLGDDDSIWAAVQTLLSKAKDETRKALGIDGEPDSIASLLGAFNTDIVESTFNGIGDNIKKVLFDDGGMVPEWDTALWHIVDSYETEFLPSISNALGTLIEENEKYREELLEVEETAGISTEDIVAGLEAVSDWTNIVRDDTDNLIGTLQEQVNTCEYLWNLVEDLISSYEGWESAIEAVTRAYEELQAVRSSMIEDAGEVPTINKPNIETPTVTPAAVIPTVTPKDVSDSGGGGDTGSGGGGNTGGKAFNPDEIVDYLYKSKDERYHYISAVYADGSIHVNWSQEPHTFNGRTCSKCGYSKKMYNIVTVDNPTKALESYEDFETANLMAAEYAQATGTPYTVKYFKTGGYTGDWPGINGKLAMLHQKELVLNADDTQNMLNAVNITRTIFDKVAAMNGIATSGLQSGGKLDLASIAGQTVLQSVTINADFPAVESAAEIKQAFNELVNLASQRASGNRRTY